MRIRFGTWIHLCSFVSYSDSGKILNVGTENGLYTIIFESEGEAQRAYDQILIQGFFDASKEKYSNCQNYYM